MIQRVTFKSENYTLVGNLHIPYSGAPCIITLHGLDSHKDSGKWPIIAEKLYSAGFACFRFNFRGCGVSGDQSEGEFENTTLTSRIKDLKAALNYLRKLDVEIDTERLGVFASSFGSMVAVILKQEFRAMVLLATPRRIPEIQINSDYITLPSGRKLHKNFFEDIRRYDLINYIKNNPPTLFIHGENDSIIPPTHSIELYNAAQPPKKLVIVKGADHIFSNEKHLMQIIDLGIKWFKRYIC